MSEATEKAYPTPVKPTESPVQRLATESEAVLSEAAVRLEHASPPGVAAPVASRLPIGPWPTAEEVADLPARNPAVLHKLYQQRDFRPAWVTTEGGVARLTESGRHVVSVLRHTPQEHGLSKRFEIPQFTHRTAGPEGLNVDLALSDLLVEYARTMGVGARLRADNRAEKPGADPVAPPTDAIVAALEPFFRDPGTVDGLESSIEPSHPEYTALVDIFQTYRDAEEAPELPADLLHLDGSTVEQQMAAIATRLQREGFWVQDADSWGARVVSSLRAYQRSVGLEETGTLNEETLRELNVPLRERRAAIRRSLAAWRARGVGVEDRYIVVNIPDFHGELWSGGERDLRFKVIVGAGTKVYSADLGKSVYQGQTPRFSDEIEFMEFNPYWWIPDGIVAEEYAPIQARDPSFYRRRGFEWGRTEQGAVHLRQKPGPNNALGQVKFLFPNKHAVYLHDTSQRDLFAKSKRNLSHGCVRVEDPLELARKLLIADGQLSVENAQEQIDAMLEKRKPQKVVLKKPVPVHLVYVPVRVGERGLPNFLPDPYGLTKK